MITLQQKLDAFKARFESGGPPYNVAPESVALMHRATDELRNSGIVGSVLKVGDKAPDFSLPDTQGQIVDTLVLRQEGPLVVW